MSRFSFVLYLKSAGFSAAADATRVSVVIGLFKVRLHTISKVQLSNSSIAGFEFVIRSTLCFMRLTNFSILCNVHAVGDD